MDTNNSKPNQTNNPILVIDTECGEELLWFKDIQEAWSYIEPYDVDTYKIYDAKGQIIRIFLDNISESFWNPNPGDVRLEPSNEFDVDDLKRILLQELKRATPHTNLNDQESLDSLIELATTNFYSNYPKQNLFSTWLIKQIQKIIDIIS